MGHTITEKILGNACGKEVVPGELVNVKVDKLMTMDFFGAIVFKLFEQLDAPELYDPDMLVVICDHLVPGHNIKDAEVIKQTRDYAKKYNIKNFYDIGRHGICHQMMVENGFVKPGKVVVGTDSHSPTYGAMGAFACGVSSSEAAVTFWLDSDVSLLLLISVYCAGIFGGSISAILLNIPGTPASAATCFDGHPLAQQGKGGKAVMTALVASTFGGLISGIALLFAAPGLAALALKFGAPETMMVAVFGLTMVASLSSEKLSKGLLMGVLGMFLGTIGISPSGSSRYTFGSINLYAGLSAVPILIGVFSIPEVLGMISSSGWKAPPAKGSSMKLTWKEVKSILPTCSVSTAIGLIIGLIPAIGPETATFMGYDRAKSMSKDSEKETFGKGNIKGVAGSEAANNAVCGTSLAPMFALGIPGSGAAMVLMGGLMIHGLTPGPSLFREDMPLLTTLFLGFILAQFFMFLVGYGASKLAPFVLRVHHIALATIILMVCMVGTFACNNNIFDVYVMLIFGFLAFFLGKAGFSCVPMVLGMILGQQFETNLRRTLVLCKGKSLINYLLGRPIALIIFGLTVITIIIPIIMQARKNKRLKALSGKSEI